MTHSLHLTRHDNGSVWLGNNHSWAIPHLVVHDFHWFDKSPVWIHSILEVLWRGFWPIRELLTWYGFNLTVHSCIDFKPGKHSKYGESTYNAISRQWFWSTLIYLMTPSHKLNQQHQTNLNQCSVNINRVVWNSHQKNFCRYSKDINQ